MPGKGSSIITSGRVRQPHDTTRHAVCILVLDTCRTRHILARRAHAAETGTGMWLDEAHTPAPAATEPLQLICPSLRLPELPDVTG